MSIIDSLMTSTVVSVEMDDSLQVIKHIFENTNFHHLLVTSDDKLIGIISDRDLLKAISPHIDTPSETSRDSATMNKRAHQIMSRNPTTLHPGATTQDAINLFNNHAISCIPVIDESQKPVGIVSWRDILKAIEEI